MFSFLRRCFTSITTWIRNNRTRINTGIYSFLKKTSELVLTGIVFAVAASLLTTWIQEKQDAKENITSQLTNLSNVYIGCNKQWMDETFGSPQFSGQKDEYLLCAYISDYYVLQVVFDQAQAAQAYLITALNNSENVDIQIVDSTWRVSDVITLGETSYYDFPGQPTRVLGYISIGNARAFYGEAYNFMSTGNYYTYYIASFDYGKLPGTVENFLNCFDIVPHYDVDEEVSFKIVQGINIIPDRKNNYPNTYGVSMYDAVGDLLFSYDWFNSQQLRNKLNVDSEQ